jgi:hypothetical protein
VLYCFEEVGIAVKVKFIAVPFMGRNINHCLSGFSQNYWAEALPFISYYPSAEADGNESDNKQKTRHNRVLIFSQEDLTTF